MLSKKFFQRVGVKALKMYKSHIFERAKDVRGNKFRGYSTKYGEMKKANRLKRQWAGSSSSRAPWVTKDFYNDLKLARVTNNGFYLQWTSQGAKVNYLADMKREVTSKDTPLPKDVANEIDRQVMKELKMELPKSKLHKIYLK